MTDRPGLDAEQAAAVLEQIAGHSSDSDIRGHVRQVIAALRGSGAIFLNARTPPAGDVLDTIDGALRDYEAGG